MTRPEAMTIAAYIGVSFPTYASDAALAALATDLERYDAEDAQQAARAMRSGRTDLRLPAWAEIREAIDQVIERKRISEDRWIAPPPGGRVGVEEIDQFIGHLDVTKRMDKAKDEPGRYTDPPWVAMRRRSEQRDMEIQRRIAAGVMSPVRANGQIKFTEEEKKLVNERIVNAGMALANTPKETP